MTENEEFRISPRGEIRIITVFRNLTDRELKIENLGDGMWAIKEP
jgi:hypothetical protein